MTYSERKEKEKHLLYLIEKDMLVSIKKVAGDFNCSEKTIKRMISSLRLEGHAINYCRIQHKYYIKNYE